MQCLRERVAGQVTSQRVRHSPAYDVAREHVASSVRVARRRRPQRCVYVEPADAHVAFENWSRKKAMNARTLVETTFFGG